MCNKFRNIEYMMNIIQTEEYPFIQGNISEMYSEIPMYKFDKTEQIVLIPTVQNNWKNKNSMIQSNYYSMLCSESKRNKTINFNFQGRINEPNITYRSKNTGIKMGYQSMELILCPTKESFSEFPFLQSYVHQHPEIQGAIVGQSIGNNERKELAKVETLQEHSVALRRHMENTSTYLKKEYKNVEDKIAEAKIIMQQNLGVEIDNFETQLDLLEETK